jgi:hypothetical protein
VKRDISCPPPSELDRLLEIAFDRGNRGGGEMVLTEVKCPNNNNGYIIVSSDSGGGNSSHGCATMMGSQRLYVSWDDGSTSVLPANGWTQE